MKVLIVIVGFILATLFIALECRDMPYIYSDQSIVFIAISGLVLGTGLIIYITMIRKPDGDYLAMPETGTEPTALSLLKKNIKTNNIIGLIKQVLALGVLSLVFGGFFTILMQPISIYSTKIIASDEFEFVGKCQSSYKKRRGGVVNKFKLSNNKVIEISGFQRLCTRYTVNATDYVIKGRVWALGSYVDDITYK